jgi:hypothetical protein
MLSTLRKVKQLNPSVSTVFYWNTILAFPFYAQVGKFAQSDTLLIDANTHSPVMLRNDNGMPGIGVYDFGKAAGRQLWQGLVESVVQTGLVDGIFGDKWSVYATPNASNSSAWAICNHWCGGITEADARAFNAGKNATLKATSDYLGPDAVFFSATDDLVKHIKRPADMIAKVRSAYCSCCAHAVLMLCSCCVHAVLMLCSCCAHTVLMLCSCCAHAVIILRSNCALRRLTHS